MAAEPAAKVPRSAARFSDQVAVITGGADGLGKSISHRLATREGARAVVIFDVDEKKAQAAVAGMRADPAVTAEVSCMQVDVADETSVKDSLRSVVDRYGRLDVVVNCAGIVGPNGVKVAEVDADEFDRVYQSELGRGGLLKLLIMFLS